MARQPVAHSPATPIRACLIVLLLYHNRRPDVKLKVRCWAFWGSVNQLSNGRREGKIVVKLRAYIRSGPVLEIEEYQCIRPSGRGLPRGGNKNRSSEEQNTINDRNARKNLERLINANFGPGDIFATLDYRRRPEDGQEKKDIRNYIRRLDYAYQKAERELKYIYVTERETVKRKVRIHHHIILSAGDFDTIEKLWTLGGVTVRRLDATQGFRELANYLSKDPTLGRNGNKRWTGSRNLKKPEIRKYIISGKRIARTPKGYIKLFEQDYVSDTTGLIHVERYIRYGATDYGSRFTNIG